MSDEGQTSQPDTFVSRPNYFETAAGQTIAGAHRYLSAAKLLRYSETWRSQDGLLQTPVLHLLGHGVELLLKFPLIAGGMNPSEVRKRFGHRLVDLWENDTNRGLRAFAMERASFAWTGARASGTWPLDDFDKSPEDELILALQKLAWLHGKESDFALRYLALPGTIAPRPAFLIDVFGEVAERGTMNPQLFAQI